jgi:hypothetical protein
LVTAAAVGLMGSGAINEVRHGLDFVEAASRGARWGARLGPVAAGTGFVTFAGGLYLWDRFHQDLFDALCGG